MPRGGAPPLQARAALNLVRRLLRRQYVHECSVDDALRVLEVMPPGRDCVVRRFVDASPPQYKVKVRGHADDDIYDETTMLSLVHSGAAHFVKCADTIQTFFRIRTPPQLQHRESLESLFLHPALPKERAVDLLKGHYFQNAQHPDRKDLAHVLLMRGGGESESIETYYIDPHYKGPENTTGAVLCKRTTLVRACSRFMPAVIVPACSTPSSMVSESHVVSIDNNNTAPAPASSQSSSQSSNKSSHEASPTPAVTSVAATPAAVMSASRASSHVSHTPAAAPPSVLGVPVPSEVGSVVSRTPTVTWPAQAASVVAASPPAAPPPPPPADLQSAPGTVFTG